MSARRSGLTGALMVALLAAVVGFVGVLQVRSQAEVERSLVGQDNASLAFLIDELHQSNDELSAEESQLQARRDTLRAGSSTAVLGELTDEAARLKLVEGIVPTQGPGVIISVDAPLSAIDLQDAINNLQVGGAQAVAINDRRVVTGTVIKQGSNAVLIDGVGTRGPWSLYAIGDPVRLAATADAMTRSLQSDSRVRAAAYSSESNLVIRAVVTARPFVYASAG